MTTDVHAWLRGRYRKASHGHHVLSLGEALTQEEMASLTDATRLLAEILEASPYERLRKRHKALHRVLSEVAENFRRRERRNPYDDFRQLSEALDDLLSAFRAFDDRTSHQLSRRYGHDSDELRAFKHALSVEYDEVFAYRFSYKLRNYSQHCGSPICRIDAGAHRLSNGEVTRRFVPLFDSGKLLAEYDGWNSRVVSDLQYIAGEFPVTFVVDQLMASCTRAYATLVVRLAGRIKEAVRVIRELALAKNESEDENYSVLVRFPDGAERLTDPRQTNQMIVEVIRLDLADAAVDALGQCIAMLDA